MTTNLPEQIAERLQRPLPGRRAQSAMAPALCYGRHHGPPEFDARPAAVLVLVCDTERWRIPMTLRPPEMSAHAGQVSFPGGMAEPGETPEQTALRETEEELGVPAADIQLLGQLTPLYVFASNFYVTPIIAAAPQAPQFRPLPTEVAEVIEVPVELLLDGTALGEHKIDRGPMSFRAPHVEIDGHRIWGASCMVLGEVTALLRDCCLA